MKSKGFTLIELVIVMVILAILVTLGVPKFLGQSDKAQKTKLISDGRVLEDAINRYYIDEGDWPRLTPEDKPLTEAELTSKIYVLNDKGFEAPFAPEEGANYYDINLEVLKPYIKSFNSDIKHFVLQNPVGSVYIQDPKENTRLSDLSKDGEDGAVVARHTLIYASDSNGTVSKTSETVDEGSSVTVTATASDGYQFDQWVNGSGEIASTDPILVINNVNKSDTYTAQFNILYSWLKYDAIVATEAGCVTSFTHGTKTYTDSGTTPVYSGASNTGIGQKIQIGGTYYPNRSNTALIGYWYWGGGSTYTRINSINSSTGTKTTYNITSYYTAYSTIYAQGTNSIGVVTSTDISAYPSNGQKDGFWYIKQ